MIEFKKLDLRRHYGGLGYYYDAQASITRGGIDAEVKLSPSAVREIEEVVLKDAKEQLTKIISEEWPSE